jgi:hypothetical protein
LFRRRRCEERCLAKIVDLGNKFAVNEMIPDDRKRTFRKDLAFAIMLFATGVAISAFSLTQLNASKPEQMAQGMPPLQSTPGVETKPAAPAEPTTTGTRPSNVRPEPARPDAEAQKAGAQPALPPAPAEKTAPPIKER